MIAREKLEAIAASTGTPVARLCPVCGEATSARGRCKPLAFALRNREARRAGLRSGASDWMTFDGAADAPDAYDDENAIAILREHGESPI